MENDAPARKTSDEERFHEDYYSYFESPENSTRYTPTASFLDHTFKHESFSVLDLGCGNAALSQYLPERCDYWGVDHSEFAIERCLKRYPNRKFVAQDLLSFLIQLAAENKKFDVVVMAGLLFYNVDKETAQRKDDQEIVQFCLDNIISDQRYLSIIVPFCYGDHPSHSLFVRAESLQKLVKEMLRTAQAKIVYENLSLQIGLDERVRQQKVAPDWFVSNSYADYSSIFIGTYMASWTFIASPKSNS
jgi:SAM-dependent methyltransferase